MATSLLALFLAGSLWAAPQPKILTKVNPLPVALNDDFQFRKTKLFHLTPTPPKSKRSFSSALSSDPNNPTASPGIYTVKSASDGTALDGTKYSDW